MNGADDNLQTTDFSPDTMVVRAFRGPRDAAYARVLLAFVVASACHLWLADAAQPDWWVANLIYVVGLGLLAGTRGAIGWVVCAVGLAIPLLFLRDQLTQSALLLAVCVAGAWATMRRPADVAGFLRAARGLMIVTYLLAAFHKLNHDFFNPVTGCASYGLRELAEYYRLAPSTFALYPDADALLAVALEVAIPLAYLVGRRHLARVLAVVFHIPLTLTMAPAFAFVMAVGHAAWLTPDDVDRLRAIWRRARSPLLAGALLATVASLLLHGSLPEWTMIPREFLLWLALFWSVAALVRRGRGRDRQPLNSSSKMPVVVVTAFVLNGFTPYLGIQFQHTGAMLSNLRIDEGCWNHFVVPESIRLTDDYLRVETVVFGSPGVIPDYEDTVLRQLWSPPQLRQMRRNWCRPEIRPFSMRGTFRGIAWEIDDLCDPDEPWPFDHDGVFGVELFGDFLRFQKNLERVCPQACIH